MDAVLYLRLREAQHSLRSRLFAPAGRPFVPAARLFVATQRLFMRSLRLRTAFCACGAGKHKY
ncbi:MAG: hypothetical protein COB75_02095 [Idiomarina sp.]|nr:MAG: hypothetical protein COB75_02095 [Idiomarina sp.]